MQIQYSTVQEGCFCSYFLELLGHICLVCLESLCLFLGITEGFISLLLNSLVNKNKQQCSLRKQDWENLLSYILFVVLPLAPTILIFKMCLQGSEVFCEILHKPALYDQNLMNFFMFFLPISVKQRREQWISAVVSQHIFSLQMNWEDVAKMQHIDRSNSIPDGLENKVIS